MSDNQPTPPLVSGAAKSRACNRKYLIIAGLAVAFVLFLIFVGDNGSSSSTENTTPPNYQYLTLDKYKAQLKGTAFLHSVTQNPNGSMMVGYYNSYAAFKQLSPTAERFSRNYFNSYWHTGQGAEKAFIHAVFTGFTRFPDVTGIGVVTIEGTRMLTAADFQVAAGATLADLRQPGALTQALDDHLYNGAIRDRFLAKFPAK